MKLDTSDSTSRNKNLIKRVENTLKSFEVKSGNLNHQEFFKTKAIVQGGVGPSSSNESEHIKIQNKNFGSMTQNHSPIDSLVNMNPHFKSSPGALLSGILDNVQSSN